MSFRLAKWMLALFVFSGVTLQAQPSGDGWVSTPVADGITYYSFSGIESVSGTSQQVFIIDWDTANPSYALRFVRNGKPSLTSSVFRRENAVATMTAAYKKESACGHEVIITDRTGNELRIGFDRKDRDSIFYGAPLVEPDIRKPRTAVALTRDGHFLMVSADGMRGGASEGMTASELAALLENSFRLRKILFLDEGSSSALCVRGQGDAQTHVVNSPSGNEAFYSHLCIVETPRSPMVNVREELLSDWNVSSGLDCVLDWSPKAETPAPKGYRATYISHYGRHGSRFAYTSDAYTILLEMLREGASADNLTPYGTSLLAQLEAFWSAVRYQVGDLSRLGWEQLWKIAGNMVDAYPKAFGRGSRVDACSSASVRAIMSMTSFVSSLSRKAPKSSVYAHEGTLDIQATRPNMGKNPFCYKGPETIFPYPESSEEFFLRHFPQYNDVLGRLFKDPVAGLGNRNAHDVFFHLYMFVGGMQSLPEDLRVDVKDIFTPQEYAILWETDNYERFREYLPYRLPCSSVVDDIRVKAQARLESGEPGADLRFGHDHVMMALLMILDIDDFNRYPASADDLVYVFQSFRSPMATNIQFVFYRPVKNPSPDNTLVKVLHNGDEVRLGDLAPYSGPYYKWTDVAAYLQARVALFSDNKE